MMLYFSYQIVNSLNARFVSCSSFVSSSQRDDGYSGNQEGVAELYGDTS